MFSWLRPRFRKDDQKFCRDRRGGHSHRISWISPPGRYVPLLVKETLLYRGGVVSSSFVTARSFSSSYRTPSREVLASLRGRRAGRHMMGSEGEAEQSENRPAEAEPCLPANSPRPSSPRGALLRRSGTQSSALRCCGVSLLAPAEFCTVDPHAVHDNRETPCQGDNRFLGTAPPRHLHAPGLEPGPCLGTCEEHLCGLVEGGAHHRVAALR